MRPRATDNLRIESVTSHAIRSHPFHKEPFWPAFDFILPLVSCHSGSMSSQPAGRSGIGMGALGLAGVLSDAGLIESAAVAASGPINPLAPKEPHFAPKAKHVIHIFLNGGLSHVDSFDPKPELTKWHGKELPTPNLKTERPTGAAFRSPYQFPQVRWRHRNRGIFRAHRWHRRHLRHSFDAR